MTNYEPAQTALVPLEGQFAEKGLELQIHVPENLPQVMADPTRAVQILTLPQIHE
jgi:signal transduction histidine kinase